MIINKQSFTISEVAHYNKKILSEKKDEFLKLFNLPLQKFLAGDLITLITGFNIADFDKQIKTPNGTSVKKWVSTQYGLKAEALITWLIQNTGYPANTGKDK